MFLGYISPHDPHSHSTQYTTVCAFFSLKKVCSNSRINCISLGSMDIYSPWYPGNHALLPATASGYAMKSFSI